MGFLHTNDVSFEVFSFLPHSFPFKGLFSPCAFNAIILIAIAHVCNAKGRIVPEIGR